MSGTILRKKSDVIATTIIAQGDDKISAKKRELKKRVVWMYGEGLIPISQKNSRLKVIEGASSETEITFIENFIF